MAAFDLIRKIATGSADDRMRRLLVQFVIKSLTDKSGRIRAEDSICLAATIVGERCIDAAGDFQLRKHNFVPGSRIFSNKVNSLINGDLPASGWSAYPEGSILGSLRSRLDPKIYTADTFPVVSELMKGYAAGIGIASDWGKVPLSVPKDNQPFVLPLQVGYNSRAFVDNLFASISQDKLRCLRISAEALGDILNLTAKVFDPAVALRLAVEIINGMSKTAPMTKEALKRVQPPVIGSPKQE
jgi:hypothetical protein